MSNRQFGPFEIVSQLGVGGMGIVYQATYLKTGKSVALKVLSPHFTDNEKARARFEREIEILKRLRHRNIVHCFGGGTQDGQRYYAMELMDAGTLEDVLERRYKLSWEKVIEVARQVSKGLEYAHNAGIIHRDLKPANLFLSKKGHLRIGDFGIAQDTQATALTAPGSTVGTYAYMAPEQITLKQPISRKTDLYALGCLLYQLLTGRTPFIADSMPEMLQQHLSADPPPVTSIATDCPIWLEALINKLLEKSPDDRYYDALAVQVALDDIGTKLAEQRSVVGTQTAGGRTRSEKTKNGKKKGKRTVAAPGLPEAERSRKRKKRKPEDPVPFFERLWVLLTALALVIGGVTWAVWPLSESQLHERAAVLMASDDPSDWGEARDKYIDRLLTDYPQGQYATQAQEWIDRIEVDLAERQALNRRDRGVKAKSSAEAQFVEALGYQEFGDLSTADRLYASLTEAAKGNAESRPFMLLSERKRREIEQSWQKQPQLTAIEFVYGKLQTAEDHFVNDRLLEAQKIWRDVKRLYGNTSGFTAFVQRCQNRLESKPVPSLESLDPAVTM